MVIRSATGVLPTWLSGDERKALRHPVELKVSVAGPHIFKVAVVVTDISSLGCHVVGPLKASTGAFVSVTVPSFTDFSGWVAWHQGADYGLDFAHPLPELVVEHLMQFAEQASKPFDLT